MQLEIAERLIVSKRSFSRCHRRRRSPYSLYSPLFSLFLLLLLIPHSSLNRLPTFFTFVSRTVISTDFHLFPKCYPKFLASSAVCKKLHCKILIFLRSKKRPFKNALIDYASSVKRNLDIKPITCNKK